MAKEKWSLSEERLLVDYFFICKKESKPVNAKECSLYLTESGFSARDPNKIRAKLNDIKRIDNGYDLTHVAKNTIKAYQTSRSKPGNPLCEFENTIEKTELAQNAEPNTIQFEATKISLNNKFLSANNPFKNAVLPEINQLRPEKDFYEYLEELLYDLEQFDRRKWSTIYQNAEINHNTANKLRHGEVQLTRNYFYRILIAMQLSDPKKAYSLIKKSGFSFRLQNEPDHTVAIAIKNNIYNRRYINEYLIDKGCDPLFPLLAKQLNQIK